MKKQLIIEIIVWIAITAYIIVSFGFVNRQDKKTLCDKISITVLDSSYNAFVQPKDILSILSENNHKILHRKYDSLNLSRIEPLILKNPSIKNAEVYKKIDGTINIDITQRKPIIRIINYNGESYYLDQAGNIMPLSEKYTARILVINGNVNEPYNRVLDINYENVDRNNLNEIEQSSKLFEIYKLAKYIHEDKFWRSQIEQIFVNENSEYELIPKVGPSLIILGNIEDYDKKFKKLKTFYKNGLPKYGWTKYKTINLKYKNQVVCEKY